MKRSRIRSVLSMTLGTLILALVFYPVATVSAQDPGVKDAWERVLEAGSYRFTADIDQTLIPRPVREMVGQGEQRVELTMQGAVRLPDRAQIELWVENGAAQLPPVTLIQDGNQTYIQVDGEIAPVPGSAFDAQVDQQRLDFAGV